MSRRSEVVIRVLLVDDDALLRSSYAEMLGDAGYHVTQAGTGRIALNMLRMIRFDILVTDVIMPDMDGLELIRAVRTFDADLRIIAISGGGTQFDYDYLPCADAFGADAGLLKPFAPDHLLDLISSGANRAGGPDRI
jgi:DNA-binding response OmpR family regulator